MVFKMIKSKVDKSAISYWYPRIKENIPTPKTTMVPVSTRDFNDYDDIYNLLDRIHTAIELNGITYPLFLKTDMYSCKWEWSDTCFVKSERDLLSNIAHLFTRCEEEGYAEITYLVIKEFLYLETAFLAFNDMPVAKERRYFIENKQVLCHHPYWNEFDIEFYHDNEPMGWEELLIENNIETDEEVSSLTRLAEWFGELIEDDGYYSVDFAMDIHGNWYLIDVANGYQSYHNESCQIFIDKQC